MRAAADLIEKRTRSSGWPWCSQRWRIRRFPVACGAHTVSDLPGSQSRPPSTPRASGHRNPRSERSGTVDVAPCRGRFHLYEGYSAQQAVIGIRLFHELAFNA